MRVFAKFTASELRLFLREPMQVFWVLLFPSILVIILGCVPAFREPNPDIGGARVIDLYVAIAIILTLATLGLQSAPLVLATYRERGILRRLATTPARPTTLLGAQLVMSLLGAIASAVIVLVLARVIFDVPLPRQGFGFAVAFLLTAGATFTIGLFIAALASSGKAANTIGTLVLFPAMFFAGLWLPREVFPGLLKTIADFTPLGAGERAVQEAMSGQWPSWVSLTVLVAYMLVFGVAAARTFRWE
ncbi:ABC transporter permease [Actinoplanes friuliensis]|jgi:ABC-2 type transport system permease protein|uniref:Transport permease protein n=1 Tax=Actinoplanes friuliensis DSM 7358 TaxID=1246995 RepID=U5W693_9ACTN|nr:ABC transporter permease [Actinoplanes friuliensis]AGZ44522.1 Putative pleiotropic drug resistance protein 7 [Actinoplanes friuliensis DSM 7358]